MTTTITQLSMVDHAQGYAKRGWYIFPVWWVNDDGSCGCGDPNCEDIGKHPIGDCVHRGVWDASNDFKRVTTWWKRYPKSNIGWHPGPSGNLAMDLDKYKDEFDATATGAIITKADEETLTSLTGGGGNHLGYATPAGEKFGSNRKGLPAGIDVRCWGGYIILPPSNHKSGNRYQWESGYGPDEMVPAPLPQKLYDILKAAQQTARAAKVAIKSNMPQPDVEQWRLPAWLIDDLNNGQDASDRSTNDFRVMCALAERGLSNDDITAIWQHYPIGKDGRYAEDGDGYLSMTLGKVRAKVGTPVGQYNGYQNGVKVNGNGQSKMGRTFSTNGHVHTNGAAPDTKPGETKPVIDKGALWVDALRTTPYTFALNTLEDTVEINGCRLDDVTRSRIYLDMIGKGVSKNYVDDCINVLAGENTYHPVQRYLNGLQWDGADHVDALLSHIRGDGRTVICADGTTQPLHSILVFRWLLGCVARALDGDKATAFKHQTPMLVFVGGQGAGKSSFVRWLCSGIGYEFHQEGPINPQKIEDQRSMVTKWIWEVSELGASLRRSDREAVKGFITQEWHTYRKPWGRSNITKPTLCNLVGSINGETGFLDDPTGHRRFLPVQITGIDWNYNKTVDVNQLWAQLVHLYRDGASPELTPAERAELANVHRDHEIENPLATYLQMYFTIAPGIGQCFTATIIQRLQAFGVNLSSNTKIAGREINDALAPMGLTRKFISIDGIKAWGWIGIQPNGMQPPHRG